MPPLTVQEEGLTKGTSCPSEGALSTPPPSLESPLPLPPSAPPQILPTHLRQPPRPCTWGLLGGIEEGPL